VRVENANFGLAVGNNGLAIINRSVFAGNTQAGIEVEGPLAASQVHVTNSMSSNNGIGVQKGRRDGDHPAAQQRYCLEWRGVQRRHAIGQQ
jgi:hypothetical protein